MGLRPPKVIAKAIKFHRKSGEGLGNQYPITREP
jgi:hypothetical protein